jgi:hypothetical protein
MYRKPIVLLCVAGLCLMAGVAGGAPLTVKVNFQLATAPVPPGYLPDSGLAFGNRGNGYTYGWSRDISADSRERSAHPDKRYDTLIHFQKGADAIWEIVIPNGKYNLLMVCGDPSNTDQTNTLNVENVIVTDPNGQVGNFDKYNVTVTVADGRLTIKPAPGSSNAKICFVDIVQATVPSNARDPIPADKATDVPKDVILGWAAGDWAQKHNVYLGTDFADVNNASAAKPLNVLASQGQTATTFDPADPLAYGKTYYWRIDEVNAPPTSTVFKGDVWSFTVEPYAYPITKVTATASSFTPGAGPERTVDGSGLNSADQHSTDLKDMWLSMAAPQPHWIQFAFDKAYKLREMWVWNSNQMIESIIGFGPKSVKIEYSLDGSAWTVLTPAAAFAQATGLPTYAANTTANLGGVSAKYVKLTINSLWGSAVQQCGLSEVRFFYIPVQARAPEPAAAATGVAADASLNWRPGREAASHKVYFGTDKQAVTDGTAAAKTVTDHSFSPSSLLLGTTYYWRVDEVNDAATPKSYAGDVWSFTTAAYAVVDEFESYNDDKNRIYDTWIDGLTDGKSGSIVGHDPAPFAELTIIHGGKQSMPMSYDNSKFSFSEAVRTFDTPQNWTANGIKSLSLYFRGAAGNTGQLYVKINSLKVSYNGAAGDIAKLAWVPWNIDLSTVGGSVSNVTKLTIGIEGAGAKGILYIDDIRLYPKVPEYFTPADPGKTNLKALYAFEGNANDTSGSGLNGTLKQATFVSSGRTGGGSAVKVEKAGYVDLGNPPVLDFSTGDWTVTAWYKTAITGTGDANKGTIYSKGGDSTGGKRYALIVSETLEGVVTLVTDDDVTKYVVDSQSKTNNDQWHFVAGQREGTVLRIYIDGQLEGSMTIPAAYNLSGTSQHNAYVGAMTNHVDSSLYKLYNGLIDDVRVYNKALSQGEILWLAGSTSPVAKPM